MTQKKYSFGDKKQKLGLKHQNDGLGEQVTMIDAFLDWRSFQGAFDRFFGPGLGQGLLGPRSI